MDTESDSWVETEALGVDLGDARLNARYVTFLRQLAASPDASIPASCTGWSDTKAAYRFIENDRINPRDLLEPHSSATADRISHLDEEIILCIQDTTFCEYHSQRATRGLGTHTHDYEHGFFLHPLLATTPNGIPLGVLAADTWVRSDEDDTEPVPWEKESERWLAMLERTDSLAASIPEKRFVVVGDRENDFYEYFMYPKQHCDILVRSHHDRRLVTGEKLWETARQAPLLGSHSVTVPKHGNRAERELHLELRSASVEINAPLPNSPWQPPFTATILYAADLNNDDDPVEWYLMTNRPCETAAQARELVQWYNARWAIEVYFRTLKTGCQIEELQMDTRKRIERTVMMYMIVAWRVMYLAMAGRQSQGLSATVFFDKQEWQAAHIITKKTMPPKKPPSLQATLKQIAALGGYLGRKRDGPPGAKSIWIGLRRIHDMAEGIMAMKQAMTCG